MTTGLVTSYLLLCLLAMGGMGAVAAAAWRSRATRAGRAALAAAGCVLGWLLAIILALLSPTASVALFWHETVRFVFVALSTPLLVLFLAAYFGVPRPSRRLLVGLFAIPGLTILLDLTNGWHHLFLATYAMARVGPFFVRSAWAPGPWFPAYAAFNSGSLIIAVVAVVLAYRWRAPLYRAQVRMFVWSFLPPSALLVFDTLSRSPSALLGMAPLGFAAMALLQAWVLLRHRLLDLVPVAREAMFAGMVDPVFALDGHGRVVDLNPAAERALGLPAGRALGARLEELLPEGVGDLPAAARAGGWANAANAQVSLALGSGASETRYYDVRVSPLGFSPGHVDGQLLVLRDITALKQAEARLAQQANQLEAIFEAKADGVGVFDRQRRLVRANRAWQAILQQYADIVGWSADPAFTALPLADQVDHLTLWDEHGRVIPREERPTSRALRGETITGASAVDEWVHGPTGRVLVLSVSAAPVRDPTGGQITGVVTIVRDVTARRQLEENLAQQERQFRTLVEHSPDVITRFDRALRHLYASPRAEAALGIPAHERVGKTYADLGLPEALYAPWERALREVFATGASRALDITSPYGEGDEETSYYRVRYVPEMGADGSVESVLGITTDISALRRTEAALRVAKTAADVARQGEERRRREAELREEVAEGLREVLATLNSKRPLGEILHAIAQQAGHLLGCAATAIYGQDVGGGAGGERRAKTDQQPSAPAPDAVEALTLLAASGLGPGLGPGLGGARPDRPGRSPLACAPRAVRGALAARWPVAVHNHHGCAPSGEGGWTGDRGRADAVIAVPAEPLPDPYEALLIVPIVVREDVYGCLLLFYTQPCRFPPEDVALAMAYADQVALAIANARLQQHIARDAAEAERNRLARELHDTVTQEIFSASLLAESIPQQWAHHRAEAEQALRHVHQATRSALAGLRVLLIELRPAALEQMTLGELLRQLGAAMTTRAGVPITVAIEGEGPPLPAAVKVAFYRVAQESLMNAVKYAGARAMSVRLRGHDAGRIMLEIADDGQGFDPGTVPAGHFGLALMRERAQAAGATVRVRSRVGRGTRVVVAWRGGREASAGQPGGDTGGDGT